MTSWDQLVAQSASKSQQSGTSWDDLVATTQAQPAATPTQQNGGEPTWGEVGQQAIQNAPQSFLDTAKAYARMASPALVGQDLAQAALHPQETASGLYNHYSKYFSEKGIKDLLGHDPVGTVADVVTLLAPGPKGTGALERVTTATERAIPKIATTAELKTGGGAALNLARDSGVYFKPEFTKPLGDTLEGVAKQMNFRPGRPGTGDLEAVMKDARALNDPKLGRDWSFGDIHAMEQDLNDAWLVAKKAGRDSIAATAAKMRDAVRQFLGKVEEGNTEGLYAAGDLSPEQATKLHNEGLQIYRKAKTAQRAEQMQSLIENDASQYVQSGQANSLKKHARQVLRQAAKGKPTGFSKDELATLKVLRDGGYTDKFLRLARKFSGPMGAMVGAQVGGPIGAGVTMAMGQGAAKMQDVLAARQMTRFIESIQKQGSDKLQQLLGEVAHQDIVGTPQGASAVKRWMKSIGTKSSKSAARSLAVTIANIAKRPDLVSPLTDAIQGLEQPTK